MRVVWLEAEWVLTMTRHGGLAGVTIAGLMDRIAREIRPETRVVALTWVHSSTGLKLPIAEIAKAIADALQAKLTGSERETRRAQCVDSIAEAGA